MLCPYLFFKLTKENLVHAICSASISRSKNTQVILAEMSEKSKVTKMTFVFPWQRLGPKYEVCLFLVYFLPLTAVWGFLTLSVRFAWRGPDKSAPLTVAVAPAVAALPKILFSGPFQQQSHSVECTLCGAELWRCWEVKWHQCPQEPWELRNPATHQGLQRIRPFIFMEITF